MDTSGSGAAFLSDKLLRSDPGAEPDPEPDPLLRIEPEPEPPAGLARTPSAEARIARTPSGGARSSFPRSLRPPPNPAGVRIPPAAKDRARDENADADAASVGTVFSEKPGPAPSDAEDPRDEEPFRYDFWLDCRESSWRRFSAESFAPASEDPDREGGADGPEGVEPRDGSFSSATAFSFWSDGPARRTPPPAGRFPATRGEADPRGRAPVPSSGSDPSFASASFRSAPPFSAEFRASASSASPRRSDVVFTASRRSFAAAARRPRLVLRRAPLAAGTPEPADVVRSLDGSRTLSGSSNARRPDSDSLAADESGEGVDDARDEDPSDGKPPPGAATSRGLRPICFSSRAWNDDAPEEPDPLAPAPAPDPPRDPDPPPPPREKLPRLVARLDARLRLVGNVSSVRCDASSGRGLRSTSSAPSACSMRPSRVTAGSDPSSNRRSSARLRPGAHSRPPANSEAQSMRRQD